MATEDVPMGWVWLVPGLFATEVLVWEGGSRIGLADALTTPGTDELAALFDLSLVPPALAGMLVLALVLVFAFGLHRRNVRVSMSMMQLPGLLATAGYWVGVSLVWSAAVVAGSTLCAWIVAHTGSPRP
jgi:hypothetical protein